MQSKPASSAQAPSKHQGMSLRTKLMLGFVLIIGIFFAGLNTYNALAARTSRRIEALAANDTLARLVAGGLLGELADNEVNSPHTQAYLHNFINPIFKLNAHNKELAFILVTDANNHVIGGQARPELSVFTGGKVLDSSQAVLDEVARLDGPLGPHMALKRFPLKLGDSGVLAKLMVGTSLARVEAEAVKDLILNAGFFMLALAILILYASLALDHMVLIPINQVVQAMRQVQTGQLETELPTHRTDEMGILAEAYNYMVRGLRDRAKLQDAFSRYVSKQVYEKFQAGQIELSGEKRQATVLFSDIRSFTTLSEQMDPNDVVIMLNEYFTVMVESIFKYEGFLNKFIGDALMAVYNVPLDQTFPELRAVCTALEMKNNLDTLNISRSKKGLFAIKMGIGINTGAVVAGNIGHKKRLEYTVIGDAVNLAQRLESQTKESNVSLLVSEATWRAVAPFVEGAALPPVMLKGKSEPVAIFRIDGLRQDMDLPQLQTQEA
jgi:class 3 adenylate cyclase